MWQYDPCGLLLGPNAAPRTVFSVGPGRSKLELQDHPEDLQALFKPLLEARARQAKLG